MSGGTFLMFRVILILFGAALLIFGVWDLVTPRARFVNSNPPAGAVILEPPSVVKVNFSNNLAAESTMEVTSTIRLRPSGEMDYLDGSSVVMKSQIDPGDPGGKSMRADLRPGLHKGLYWISWQTKSEGWGAISYGKTYFTVGMPVPAGITRDMQGAIWERNYQWRRRRSALVGGVVMIVLGLFIPLSKRGR